MVFQIWLKKLIGGELRRSRKLPNTFCHCIQAMLDYPQLNKPGSRMPIKGFLYYNNLVLNSVKGRNEEQSMIATYRYILRKNSQFKGLPQLEKSLFLKVLRGLLRSESRLLELKIIKECGDQARLLKKWTVKTMREVMPCRVCLQLPKLSIASEYYYCCSCKILFKTCVSF